MKIAIVGTGAMGSIYAGLFASAGHEVWAIDKWREHTQAISKNGLRVEGASGDRIVKNIKASTQVEDCGHCDLYMIATKASDVESAAQSIANNMTSNNLVITIQNGLGAGEKVNKYLPSNNIVLGVADGFGASIRGPGHTHHNSMKLIRLGEMKGGITERLKTLVEMWKNAGFTVKAFADIEQLIWEKFICNVTLSASCTAFDCTVGELISNPERWAVALGCMNEAYQIGKARKIHFSFDDPIDYVTKFSSMLLNASPSMRLDHMAHRPSELDAINGQVVKMGKGMHIPTPYNESLCAVLKAREANFIN